MKCPTIYHLQLTNQKVKAMLYKAIPYLLVVIFGLTSQAVGISITTIAALDRGLPANLSVDLYLAAQPNAPLSRVSSSSSPLREEEKVSFNSVLRRETIPSSLVEGSGGVDLNRDAFDPGDTDEPRLGSMDRKASTWYRGPGGESRILFVSMGHDPQGMFFIEGWDFDSVLGRIPDRGSSNSMFHHSVTSSTYAAMALHNGLLPGHRSGLQRDPLSQEIYGLATDPEGPLARRETGRSWRLETRGL